MFWLIWLFVKVTIRPWEYTTKCSKSKIRVAFQWISDGYSWCQQAKATCLGWRVNISVSIKKVLVDFIHIFQHNNICCLTLIFDQIYRRIQQNSQNELFRSIPRWRECKKDKLFMQKIILTFSRSFKFWKKEVIRSHFAFIAGKSNLPARWKLWVLYQLEQWFCALVSKATIESYSLTQEQFGLLLIRITMDVLWSWPAIIITTRWTL